MLAVVKTPRTNFRIEGDISTLMLEVLKGTSINSLRSEGERKRLSQGGRRRAIRSNNATEPNAVKDFCSRPQ
jgi:hypothetical protein